MGTRGFTECQQLAEGGLQSSLPPQYLSEEQARQQMISAFPSVERDVIEELAFLVGKRRYTMQKVVEMLQHIEESMQENSPLHKKLGPGQYSEVQKQQGNQETIDSNARNPSSAAPNSNHQNQPGDGANVRRQGLYTGAEGELTACPLPPSEPSDDPSGIVKMFFTSMTGDRRTRDHCRQANTLLYLKRISYEAVNVADSPTLQRKLREMYATSTGKKGAPPLPAVFVGANYVGNYEEIQEMEDDGVFMDTLSRLGYRHGAHPTSTS